jgi:hypothetical protein
MRMELRELKAHSTLLVACTTCPLFRFDLEASVVETKDLKHQLDHSSRYTILSALCEMCVSLKGKLFRATKENTELKQEVAYLASCLEKPKLSEKIIEDDLSQVEKSETKSTYKLGVGFERCEDKGERSAPKFVPNSNYHKEEEALKSIKTHYPCNPKSSFNPNKKVKRETPRPSEEAFICMFCGRACPLDEFCFRCKRIEKRHFKYARDSYHLDEFCFRYKRIENRHFEYARDSYRDEFFDFLPCSYSRAPPRSYSHGSPRTFSLALPRVSH